MAGRGQDGIGQDAGTPVGFRLVGHFCRGDSVISQNSQLESQLLVGFLRAIWYYLMFGRFPAPSVGQATSREGLAAEEGYL